MYILACSSTSISEMPREHLDIDSGTERDTGQQSIDGYCPLCLQTQIQAPVVTSDVSQDLINQLGLRL